jgi:ketosteroid isomerase-like protein
MRNDGELDPAQRDHIIDIVADETFQASSMEEDQMGAGAELIKQTYEAFGRGDIPTVLDKLAEDVQWSAPRTVPQGGQFQGRSGVLQFFQGLGGAWKTHGLDVEAISEAGDLVVGVVRAEGTLRGGTPSGYGAVHVFTVHDGKIVRFREYTDLDGPLN